MDPFLITTDSIIDGRIRLMQPKEGYRFSVDAVLLAQFAAPRPEASVCDLGTGCGVVALILAHRFPGIRVFGVEIQEDLARLARANVEANGLTGRVSVLCADLKALPCSPIPPRVDMVVSNPPYRTLGAGRVNPQSQKAMARHELGASVADVAAAASRLLGPMGRFAVVFPATRLPDLVDHLRQSRLEPKRLRMVHSTATGPARLVLMESAKLAGPELEVLPPLFLYDQSGRYTPEARSLLFTSNEPLPGS